MECAACGTPLTPGFVACPACGTPYDLESAPPEDDDPPTETMPAVLAPAAAPEPSAPGVGLAPPLAPPPPAPVYVVERRRGLLEGNGPLLIGGLIGVLGALVLLAALAAMGGPGGFGLPAGVLGTATGLSLIHI